MQGFRTTWDLRAPAAALLAGAAVAGIPLPTHAACGGIATATCVSAFSTAETPPGVGAIPRAGFSFLGAGAFSVTLVDALAGATGVDVRITDGGEASVRTGATVTGTEGDGVSASSAAGPVTIGVGAGGVYGALAGVRAVSGGAGNITIGGSGPIVGGADAGVVAQSAGGNIFINPTSDISGASGVNASTTGAGGLTIQTRGRISGNAGDGVTSRTENGNNVVLVDAGKVSGARHGVNASATGSGGVIVVTAGNITGGSGAGILATTNTGASQVVVNSGVTVSGGTAGVSINSTAGTSSVVNNGLITGTGGVAFMSNMGSGTATLNNNGIVRAETAVLNNGGTLDIVNNATLDGSVSTANGATTRVNNVGAWTRAGGSTISSLTNAGSLSFSPAGAVPSTLNITGDANFTATSWWTTRLTSTGVDRIVVGGATTISGGNLVVNIGPGSYRIGQAYELLSSAGGINGAFTQAYINGGHFTSQFTWGATSLTLTLGYGDLRPLARTGNQIAVANAFWTATRKPPTGAAENLLTAIYSQSDAGTLASLSQFNGDAAVGAYNTNLASGRMFAGALTDRQSAWRAGLGQPGAPARGWYTGSESAKPAAGGREGFSVWSNAMGTIGSFQADAKTGAAAHTSKAGGAALGLDYEFGAGAVGVALGVSEGSFKAGAATGTAKGVHVGVHGGMTVGNFYGSASLTGAAFNNETTRAVAGPPGFANESEKGKFRAREGRGRLEVGWRDETAELRVSPFAAFEVASLQSDRFVETLGTGAIGLLGMNYAAQTTVSATSTLGLRFDGEFSLGNGMIVTPSASLAWVHEYSPSRATRAELVALPGASFTVAGPQPASNTIQVKLETRTRVSKHIALFTALEGEFSSKGRNITGRGGMVANW